jgi:hypothetical protein
VGKVVWGLVIRPNKVDHQFLGAALATLHPAALVLLVGLMVVVVLEVTLMGTEAQALLELLFLNTDEAVNDYTKLFDD